MSKYDDVQQFKNKVNMKDIDYKEFPNDDSALALHRWPIVEQIAEEGLGASSSLDRSMQPTPASATEFSSMLPSGLEPQPAQQPRAAPINNQLLPGHATHDFKQIIPPVTEPSRDEPFVAPIVSQAAQPSQPVDASRFKKMFSKKTPSVEAEEVSANTGRNTLLKPLLENIASCR
ncbi:hypothetical protein Z042_20750 [Chania multitudinisentens RB-25]|uniref:Cellulose biosynthesis protein BcsO n=2 Tax=Chania TaxID=1745211 RepID=W0LKU9_9GAMM|nr:hypothetical protein Z042_20750 [Chania multitudinisentens RB-25]